jgi:hypothetical protein
VTRSTHAWIGWAAREPPTAMALMSRRVHVILVLLLTRSTMDRWRAAVNTDAVRQNPAGVHAEFLGHIG